MNSPPIDAQQIQFNQADPRDTVLSWVAQLQHLGHSLVCAIAPHPGAQAIGAGADMATAEYIAARLNRAAYLEQCVIGMAAGLVELHNHALANGQMPGVTTASLMQNLQTIWAGPQPAPPGMVLN